MAKQVINLGTAPSGTTGDDRRSAWLKAKANFTELYNWISGLNQSDDTATALPAVLPVSKGGTGGANKAAACTGLGVGASDTVSFAAIELSSSTPWIDFHAGNSAADYTSRLIARTAGTLLCEGSRFGATGYLTRTGESGANQNNVFNIAWTSGAADLYVDVTRIGSLQVTSSDYRIKKNITTVEGVSFLDRIDRYRVVEYEIGDFDVWKGDGTVYQGVIAHEAQEVNPRSVSGEKDAVAENGTPLIQQLNHMAFITDLIGAVKELRAEVASLKAQLASPPDQV
ncbi:tail fiber domain-containing protein [Pseudomonas sp. TWI929]|uniref:tail fiber domain-containing protein n=1 Tax=Pseudomonas sp. TWI929 TaxID=3136795 RepID=UPI003208945D